jgi:hypothetical protein
MDQHDPRKLLEEVLPRLHRFGMMHGQEPDQLRRLAQHRVIGTDDERLFAELVPVIRGLRLLGGNRRLRIRPSMVSFVCTRDRGT